MTEREAFEAFATNRWGASPVWRGTGPCDLAWAAWQASRQQALEEAAKRIESGPPPMKRTGGLVEIGARARVAFADAIRSLTSPIGDKA